MLFTGFCISLIWIGYLLFGRSDEVMIDGITTSATIVTILSITLSVASWSLFARFTHNLNPQGVMLAVIIGLVIITPFRTDLGPSAAIIVGIVAGFSTHMIFQKILYSSKNKSLLIGIITIFATYAVLFAIIASIQSTHLWDTSYGTGAWMDSG